MSSELKEQNAEYDELIKKHYAKETERNELKATCTMGDERTRELESALIISWVTNLIHESKKDESELTLIDIGCGNGFTLGLLRDKFPKLNLKGLEFSDELRNLAQKRFENDGSVDIVFGDIRIENCLVNESVDFLLSQRVLINLLNAEDQNKALNILARAIKPDGYALFVEAFQSGLDNLNEARAEFDLERIPPAIHNLYLNDDFFNRSQNFELYPIDGINKHFLSTHYYVARVIHPLALGNREFKRNSHFVKFYSQSLAQNIGEYSPLQSVSLRKKG